MARTSIYDDPETDELMRETARMRIELRAMQAQAEDFKKRRKLSAARRQQGGQTVRQAARAAARRRARGASGASSSTPSAQRDGEVGRAGAGVFAAALGEGGQELSWTKSMHESAIMEELRRVQEEERAERQKRREDEQRKKLPWWRRGLDW